MSLIILLILGLVTLGFGIYRDDVLIILGVLIIAAVFYAYKGKEVVTFLVCKTKTQTFAPAPPQGLDIEALKKTYGDALQCEEVKMTRTEAYRVRKLMGSSK
jgi:hypothetical protein